MVKLYYDKDDEYYRVYSLNVYTMGYQYFTRNSFNYFGLYQRRQKEMFILFSNLKWVQL